MTLVPLLVGVAVVLQGALNREVATRWGLASAVLLNSAVFCVVAGGLYLAARAHPASWPAGFAPQAGRAAWWFVVPGLLGMVIVVGVPWSIARLGAAQVFVAVVAAQMVASLAWDAWMLGIPPTAQKVGGAALAVTGAWLAGRSP